MKIVSTLLLGAVLIFLSSCGRSRTISIEKPDPLSVHTVNVELRQSPQGDLVITVDPYLVEINSTERIEWTFQSPGFPPGQVTFDVQPKTGKFPNQGNPPDDADRRQRGPFNHTGGGKPIDGAYNVIFTVNGQQITVDPGYRIYP